MTGEKWWQLIEKANFDLLYRPGRMSFLENDLYYLDYSTSSYSERVFLVKDVKLDGPALLNGLLIYFQHVCFYRQLIELDSYGYWGWQNTWRLSLYNKYRENCKIPSLHTKTLQWRFVQYNYWYHFPISLCLSLLGKYCPQLFKDWAMMYHEWWVLLNAHAVSF